MLSQKGQRVEQETADFSRESIPQLQTCIDNFHHDFPVQPQKDQSCKHTGEQEGSSLCSHSYIRVAKDATHRDQREEQGFQAEKSENGEDTGQRGQISLRWR